MKKSIVIVTNNTQIHKTLQSTRTQITHYKKIRFKTLEFVTHIFFESESH